MGELSEALTLLDVNAKSRAIVDRVAVMETRGVFLSYDRCALIDSLRMTARLLSRQGSGTEAEQAWHALIHCNPDNTSYYYGLFNSKNIDIGNICPTFWRIYSSTDFYLSIGAVTDADRSNTLHLLQDLSKQNPRTTTPERLELMVVSGRSQPYATTFAHLMF
jgi:N-alpha-acetyltransferase 15/16, NatA auxiliary subunit